MKRNTRDLGVYIFIGIKNIGHRNINTGTTLPLNTLNKLIKIFIKVYVTVASNNYEMYSTPLHDSL